MAAKGSRKTQMGMAGASDDLFGGVTVGYVRRHYKKDEI